MITVLAPKAGGVLSALGLAISDVRRDYARALPIAFRETALDVVERAVRVLEPANLSLLTDRRRHGPAGRDGGAPGQPGQNLLNAAALPPQVSVDLAAGDIVSVRTPGGGWGSME